MSQHFNYLVLAVVLGGKVGESLHPQVGVLMTEGEGREKKKGLY